MRPVGALVDSDLLQVGLGCGVITFLGRRLLRLRARLPGAGGRVRVGVLKAGAVGESAGARMLLSARMQGTPAAPRRLRQGDCDKGRRTCRASNCVRLAMIRSISLALVIVSGDSRLLRRRRLARQGGRGRGVMDGGRGDRGAATPLCSQAGSSRAEEQGRAHAMRSLGRRLAHLKMPFCWGSAYRRASLSRPHVSCTVPVSTSPMLKVVSRSSVMTMGAPAGAAGGQHAAGGLRPALRPRRAEGRRAAAALARPHASPLLPPSTHR